MHQINVIEGTDTFKGKGVKLEALIAAIDGTKPPGVSLMLEEINDMEISVLNTEDIVMAHIKKKGKKQFGILNKMGVLAYT